MHKTMWVRSCLLLVFLFLCPATFGAQKTLRLHRKPQLRAITVYQWALQTGGSEVDLQHRQLKSFVRGVPKSDEDVQWLRKQAGGRYPVCVRIQARLSRQDIAKIRTSIENSGLHDFHPSLCDMQPRQANFDECPPTLVIIWSDKRRVFHLPLPNTVRKDIAPDRWDAYRNMDKLCQYVLMLDQDWAKKPHVSPVAVQSKEYRAFERKRDNLLK